MREGLINRRERRFTQIFMKILQRFFEWLKRKINDRRHCPKCGCVETGVLIGEWDGFEMRECEVCKHYWEEGI